MRTILDEVLGFRPDFMDHELANKVKDPNGGADNGTAHLPEPRKMIQQWADYLEKLKARAEIIRPIGAFRMSIPASTARVPRYGDNDLICYAVYGMRTTVRIWNDELLART